MNCPNRPYPTIPIVNGLDRKADNFSIRIAASCFANSASRCFNSSSRPAGNGIDCTSSLLLLLLMLPTGSSLGEVDDDNGDIPTDFDVDDDDVVGDGDDKAARRI